jgi:hypothetical protein
MRHFWKLKNKTKENETKRSGINGIFAETKRNKTKNNWENEKRKYPWHRKHTSRQVLNWLRFPVWPFPPGPIPREPLPFEYTGNRRIPVISSLHQIKIDALWNRFFSDNYYSIVQKFTQRRMYDWQMDNQTNANVTSFWNMYAASNKNNIAEFVLYGWDT